MKAQRKLILTALAVALMVATVPGLALAGGTRAGSDVDNTAVVSWNAGSFGYTTSDTVSFKVDELINIQVTNNVLGTNLAVWPGETDRPLAFDVVNAGNSTIDIRVQAIDDGSLFVTNVTIYTEAVTAGFNSTDDTDNTSVNFIEASIPVDTVYTYYIVADVGASPVTTNTPDVYDLVVTAVNGAGNAITADNIAAFNGTTVEQVMADTGGTYAGFADYDGRDSAQATYNLSWADLTLTKSFEVIGAGFNTTNDHAIPGSTVEYTLHVLNSGNAAATGVSITDATPLGTTFGTFTAPSQGSVLGTNPVIWSIPSLAGSSSADLVFDVLITGP
jgi:uncharacterized repeat protein (TIGR01451 family)